MNEWISPKDKLPEQGKKVLCCDKHDYYVAQRFGKYWLQIPFTDSYFATTEMPEYWQEINFHGEDRGYLNILYDDEFITCDEYEKLSEVDYNLFISNWVKMLGKNQ